MLESGDGHGATRLVASRSARSLFAALYQHLWPGRSTRFVVDDIVAAATHGEPASVEPVTDWPYIYIDDAADAAVAACFSVRRRQLFYFIAYPEQVTLEDFARGCGA